MCHLHCEFDMHVEESLGLRKPREGSQVNQVSLRSEGASEGGSIGPGQ